MGAAEKRGAPERSADAAKRAVCLPPPREFKRVLAQQVGVVRPRCTQAAGENAAETRRL